MQTILQLSDFHITSEMPAPKKQKAFSKLVEKLKDMHFNPEDLILVYNGDVIDWTTINSTIDPELPDDEKAKKWDEEAEKAYRKAKEYFDYLTNELGISSNHIIICCGNHDVNTYYTGAEIIPCTLPDGKAGYKFYNENRFKKYLEFCESIQGSYADAKTHFRQIGDLNFLVINSNWVNKWVDGEKQLLCIGCREVDEKIRENKAKLIKTKEKNRLLNVLVAHAPRTDYCENALYWYLEKDKKEIEKTDATISRYFGLRLYGDKHTDNEHNFDYIVGAPLTEEAISYGIHEYDAEKHHHHKSLIYRNNQWGIRGSENEVSSILAISKKFIKEQALKYLFGVQNTDKLELEKEIIKFEEVREEDKWKNLDILFKASSDLKQETEKDKSMVPVDVKDGFINTLTRIISEAQTKDQTCLTVRGDLRVGKSVCMTVLYLNMLYRYANGTNEYIPVYIDVGQLREYLDSQKSKGEENLNTAAFGKKFMKEFKSILQEGLKKASDLQRPACCIIDGIDQYVLYKKANIENSIDLEMKSGIGKDYSKIIYCIDTGHNGIERSKQDEEHNSLYIMYMNKMLTKKVSAKDKYTAFIEAFCKLRGVGTDEVIQRVKERIDKMHILEIDTNLLLKIWNELINKSSSPKEDEYFELVERQTNSSIPADQMDNAAKACYLYNYRPDRSYDEIKRARFENVSSNKLISNKTFEVFRTQKEVARYLIARNYANYIKKEGLSAEDYDLVNELFDHRICSFIRAYIKRYNMDKHVLGFAERHFDKLSYEGKATIVYLLGRLDKELYGRQVKRLLDSEKKLLEEYKDPDSSENYPEKEIAWRSIVISNIYMSPEGSIKELAKYLNELIRNEESRKVNREFYLQFYGDRSMKSKREVIYNSLDFYNTYHLIASRLEEFEKTGKEYTLLALELFTLCDLFQIRLGTPMAETRYPKNGEIVRVPSFFYDKKFNKPKDDMAYEALAFIIPAIKKFINIYTTRKEMELFISYLRTQVSYFEQCLKKLEKAPLISSEDAFNPVSIFEELSKIKSVKRMGWLYHDTLPSHISADEYMKMQDEGETIETTLEHTYMCYLIGLLYLPAVCDDVQGYDKQKILNMLLIHDLGETYVGDIIPHCEKENELRDEETAFSEKLYMMGIKPEISDLSDYLLLWNEWSQTGDENGKIAKEIDKIQMLYELLCLLKKAKKGEVSYTRSRIRDFWKDREKITTNIGKKIFNILIANNASFKEMKVGEEPIEEIISLAGLK